MVTHEQLKAAEALRRKLASIERKERQAIASAHKRSQEATLEALDGVDGEVLAILQIEVAEETEDA